ncbi:ImmA/IrrE family metallo-endopeptidase [uncultured Vagococcus sp.]|uniref:ImmA/IrrE family metallo-endopeptidase n=1 Tax=uncultured Vagococcus sp. TaxID=189676 RepID=UPI0028D2D629|nr:ImmA/IrrE family metallo-endopeptidase [uncultured Vagococcus sp.]
MQKIMRKLQELGIDLILADIEDGAHYLPDCKTIIANNHLEESELIAVILHEIKHIISHTDYIALYVMSSSYRSKMEYEADLYMIEELISENDGYFNFSALLEEYRLGIGMEDILKLKIAQ